MTRRMGLSQILVFLGVMGFTATVAIGSSAPVGSLVGSKNATLDGQVPLPHTTVLSGDNLQVNDGLAMMTLDQGNRMILGRGTEASFLREADVVTVSLARGNMSLYHPEASRAFRVKVGDVTVVPVKGYRTLGQIVMLNGLLLVTAKDGALQVEKAGTIQEVGKGKTITIATMAAGDHTPNPKKKRGKKRIFYLSGPETLLIVGLASEAGFTAWAIVAANSGGKPTPVSPIMPTP